MTASHSPFVTTSPVLTTPFRQDAEVIGLVGMAHLLSHFSQLLLAPLFPWLKETFNASYADLGFLMTVFFVVSCAVQALSGFVVDRLGPRQVLFAGVTLLGLAAFGFAASTSYGMLAAFSVLAGIGNGVFHPVDYTLLNRKVSALRLGHAYSFHGISGSLGWALAPAMLVPLALAFSWRVALVGAGLLAFTVLAVLLVNRHRLSLLPAAPASATGPVEHSLAFLRIPAVWTCFAFFFFYAISLGAVHAFAPVAAGKLHGVPVALVAYCLSIYMVCSASGMVLGGFLAAKPARCERIVAGGMGVAAAIALVLGLATLPAVLVPVLFGMMGFAAGISGPSRDLLVKQSTSDTASGRVYGVVYAGMDIGQAIAPLLFGLLMDQQQYTLVFLGLALAQGLLVFTAFKVRRTRRTLQATPCVS